MTRTICPAWIPRVVLAVRVVCTLRAATGIAAALALGMGLAACSPSAPREYVGHGEAVEVDATARTVTLEHGDIPDLMKGMTMTFDVAPSVDLATLAPGTEVDFRLSDADGGLTVVEIRPIAP